VALCFKASNVYTQAQSGSKVLLLAGRRVHRQCCFQRRDARQCTAQLLHEARLLVREQRVADG
jgi:hypothetical protein